MAAFTSGNTDALSNSITLRGRYERVLGTGQVPVLIKFL